MELNKIDLNKLNTFLAVVEQGGVSAAASRLLLTRSAVSQNVSSLERSLGVPLFHRVGKKLIPTPAGKRLHRSFRSYQQNLRKTVSELVEGQQEARGMVRLGLFMGFSKSMVTDVISDFAAQYPKASLKLLFRSQRELTRLLASNRLDLALSLHPLSRGQTAITSRKLYEEELHLVCDEKLKQKIATPADALKAPLIDYYESSPVFPSWVKHHFGREVSSPDVRAYAGTLEYALELILKGVGIGVIPQQVADPWVKRGALSVISTGKPEMRHFIWLNELKGSNPEQAVELFKSALSARVSRHEN